MLIILLYHIIILTGIVWTNKLIMTYFVFISIDNFILIIHERDVTAKKYGIPVVKKIKWNEL